MSRPDISQPIFYDPEGRRQWRVGGTAFAVAAVVTVLAAVLIASLLINPLLPQLSLRPIAALPHAVDIQLKPPLLPATRPKQSARRAEAALRRALRNRHVPPTKRPSQTGVVLPGASAPSQAPASPLVMGFYVNWDNSSYQSLKRHIAQIDWLLPEWIRLQDGPDPLLRNIDPRVLDLVGRQHPQTRILPLVQNYRGGVWDADLLRRSIMDKPARDRLITALTDFVVRNRFSGVCIDFENVPGAARERLLHFMQELHTAFRTHGRIVVQAVPFDDPAWNYVAYAASADYLLLMAYDQHWSTSEPGSIAGQDWFERILEKRMRSLQPAKTIVGIGAYGYDWVRSGRTTTITFQEAMLSARDSDARIQFDPVRRNPYFAYREDDGLDHTVWLLDAVTAYNQVRAASYHNPSGFAVWRLGSEDPSLWSFLGSSQTDPSGLRRIQYGYDVDYEGMGEILQVVARPQDGGRVIKINPIDSLIETEEYTVLPSSYVIRRTGNHAGLIALTFDDGPDPLWTSAILRILKQENVPATFFIIGRNGQANPTLVRRIVEEGHDIGNHTFTHPNLGEMPGRITDLELNATQRLIESLIGRSTVLFRPPYFGDAEPSTADEVRAVVRAQRLGYITVGLRIDTEDWARPGADTIIKRTIEGATNPDPDSRGQVVLLHDGGGDRKQTVDALPEIIRALRAKGFRFVTVSQLAGLTRDQAMPPLPKAAGFLTHINAVTFYTLSFSEWMLHWIFLIGILFGLGRLFFIGALALAQWRRARRRARARAGESFSGLVSVIVPAYNEERVIVRTIESLLTSTYPSFEILVVDDGSTDRTSEVVQHRFAAEPRVRLFTKENGGKSEALNFGLRRAKGEIVIALDADTVFQPDTIGALAKRFDDPRIGAVAGNAKVGNRVNLITRWQALEYITSQNLDRRAFASLNAITVVPGAVGAWRRDLIARAGGFTSDTLAEDQDLTLRVRRLGYKIGYEEHAVAWTEAPDTVRTLAKQRFRWSYGTLQCMWKHRDALFRPRYGALGSVAMPNVWIFQILFPLISPVMDLMLLWMLASAGFERWQHPTEYMVTGLERVLFYYALFLAVDWIAAAFAFSLERREQWGLLWWLFLQRFCYRQVMYYVMIKSVLTAVRGAVVGWGKLERKATVQAPP